MEVSERLCDISTCSACKPEFGCMRAHLIALIEACDEANKTTIRRFGGVVIDHAVIAAAARAVDGTWRFCGGWENILNRRIEYAPTSIDWDLPE